jgi:hypothetical protein
MARNQHKGGALRIVRTTPELSQIAQALPLPQQLPALPKIVCIFTGANGFYHNFPECVFAHRESGFTTPSPQLFHGDHLPS